MQLDYGKNVMQRTTQLVVNVEHAGRRVDNFLIGYFSTVPKSRVYRMIRTGEVRVNKGRIKQYYRLQTGDQIRIPPVVQKEVKIIAPPQRFVEQVTKNIIYEDQVILALNKPANLSVHSGSGVQYGVIETLRASRPEAHYLELVHRLDRATSGCLLIAKEHSILRKMHDLLRSGKIKKKYLALLKGRFGKGRREVDTPLDRPGMGRRQVVVDESGKQAVTVFHLLRHFKTASLVQVELMTGRMHQIRVHAAHIDHPLAGDDKYGDWAFNRLMKKAGLKRLFLHAESVSFVQPVTGKEVTISAELPDELRCFLKGFG